MPPGIEHNTEEQLAISNPIREETLAGVRAAQDVIEVTDCGSQSYNDCTEHFEEQREELRTDSQSDRLALLWEIQTDSTEVWWESIFAWKIWGYIEATNKSILENPAELNTQIEWYLTAFWSESWSGAMSANLAYFWASTVLETSTLNGAIQELESIQNSSQAVEVKLFLLSQMLYKIGKEAGAPAALEDAHNRAMWNILDAVIQSWNGSIAISFLNAQYQSGEIAGDFYPESTIESLTEMTLDKNLNTIENPDIRTLIMQNRIKIASLGLVSQLGEIYKDGPDIMDILSAITTASVEWTGDSFNYDGINSIISEYNDENQTDYPLMQGDLLSVVEDTLKSIHDSQYLAQDFSAKMTELVSVRETAERTINQMSTLRQDLRNETNPERQWELREQIRILQMRNFRLQQELAETENEAEDLENAAQASILDTEWWVEEMSNILRSTINEQGFRDIASAEDIIQNPSRVRSITSKSVIMALFTGSHKNDLSELNFQDIDSSLRGDKDVVRAFPWQISWENINFLSHNILSDNTIIFNMILTSVRLWNTNNITPLLLASMRSVQNSFEWFEWSEDKREGLPMDHLIEDLVEEMKNLNENEKEILRSHIPLSLQERDRENLLGIRDKTEYSPEALSYYIEKLESLPYRESIGEEKDENAAIKIVEEIDRYLEMRGITYQSEPLLSWIIEKWFLSKATFGNQNISKSIVMWWPIVDRVEQNSFADLQYIPLSTRNSAHFQDYLLSKITMEQWGFVRHYIILEDMDSLHSMYTKLQDKTENWSDVAWFISLEPRFISIAENALNSGEFATLSREKQELTIKVITEGKKFRESFHTGRENVSTQLEQDSENWWEKLWIFIGWLEICKDLDPTQILALVELATSTQPSIHEAAQEIVSIFQDASLANEFIIQINSFTISENQDQIDDYIQDAQERRLFSETQQAFLEQANIDQLVSKILSDTSSLSDFERTIKDELQSQGFSDAEIDDIYSEIFEKAYFNLINAWVNHKLMQDPTIDPTTIPTWKELHNYVRSNIEEITKVRDQILIESKSEIVPEDSINTENSMVNSPLPQNIQASGEWYELSYAWKNWVGKIPITKEDLKIIRNNPEAEKNIINTYQAFKRVWWEDSMWNIKDSIFKAVSNTHGINFNINGDYINDNELKILFNSVLTSVWEEKVSTATATIDGFLAAVERKNGTTISWQEAEVNSFWETKIEEKFLQEFFPRWSTAFKYSAFEDAMKT